MPVDVQRIHLCFAPSTASEPFALDNGKRTESNGHPGDGLAANRHGEFLAMISHELRNLLGSIVSGVAFVRETESCLPQSDWLWTGFDNATRQVQNLLADLMDLSQATHPTFQLRSRPMDLAAAVHAAVERQRSDFERKGLRLALRVGAEPIWIMADPERLELVLGNLLDNSAKYTERGGRVTVTVEAAGAEVVVRVRDTGVGIAPEVLPFVFDPFVRERVPGARQRQGSGIGLLLVRTLVELHGGQVEASSAGRGQGSEFVVRLPASSFYSM